MARSSLISHVDDGLAVLVKSAAEGSGMTTSAYIARVLAVHTESRKAVAIYNSGNVGVAAAKDVEVDQVIVVDPVMGMERVIRAVELDVKDHGALVKFQLERHLPRTGEGISRFVFRGQHEPCLVISI